jgi:small acid-soluble spore protein H (minor)
MDLKRVKQILSSPADIKVLYEGTSVWIDGVDENKKLATVHDRNPLLEEKTQVPIEDLVEEDGA